MQNPTRLILAVLAACLITPIPARAAVCAAPYSAGLAYAGGTQVSYDMRNYRAAWWTQNQVPPDNSGPPKSGKPWVDEGPCLSASGLPAPVAPKSAPPPPPAPTPAGSTGFYSPYKDVAISANWNTSVISSTVTGAMLPVVSSIPHLSAVTWAFATGECGQENWGGISGQALASANVSAWAALGKGYILSTGGAAGSFTCTSDAGFRAFIDRYASASLKGVDFDIEAGQSSATIDALVARVKAAKASGPYTRLRYSFTIATLGGAQNDNLGDTGRVVMQAIKAQGLTGVYINLMAMDYGQAIANNCTLAAGGKCDMAKSAARAATTLHMAYGVPYSFIELTPMIGGNDTIDEVFTLEDVATLSRSARALGLGGLHIWSLDRDRDCPPGFASPTCNSYGKAGALGFSTAFFNTY